MSLQVPGVGAALEVRDLDSRGRGGGELLPFERWFSLKDVRSQTISLYP